MKIEDIKARCASIVDMLQRTCSTKDLREWPDNTLPGTQRYGHWVNNRTKTNLALSFHW